MDADADDAEHATGSEDKAFILRLPNEILLEIVKLSIFVSDYKPTSNHRGFRRSKYEGSQTVLSLVKLCRRVAHIAIPFLYSSLNVYCISGGLEKHKETARLLHRTLLETPTLRPHCRELNIWCGSWHRDDIQDEISYVADDFARWLTAVESFKLQGARTVMAVKGWGIVCNALVSMPNLQRLSLDNAENDTDLAMLLQVAADLISGQKRLETVYISGSYESSEDGDCDKLKELRGTAHFTDLTLVEFNQTPEVLTMLAQWPARLRRFRLHSETGAADTRICTRTVMPALAVHKQTLRMLAIHISDSSATKLEGFDLSDFPNLEDLSLSSECTGTDATEPKALGALRSLLAPRLRKFRWVLPRVELQTLEVRNDLDPAQDRWLRDLVDLALACRPTLRTVQVRFVPEELVLSQSVGLDTVQHAWARMAAIRKDYASRIRVAYREPTTITQDLEV